MGFSDSGLGCNAGVVFCGLRGQSPWATGCGLEAVLGVQWVVISRVTSRVTMLITKAHFTGNL